MRAADIPRIRTHCTATVITPCCKIVLRAAPRKESNVLLRRRHGMCRHVVHPHMAGEMASGLCTSRSCIAICSLHSATVSECGLRLLV